MSLDDKIAQVRAEFEKDAAALPSEQLKTRYVGPKGKIRDLFGELKAVPPAETAAAGQMLTAFKAELEKRVDDLSTARPAARPRAPVDLTLPGRAPELGRRHPIYETWDEIARVFAKLGFDVVYGPEIET